MTQTAFGSYHLLRLPLPPVRRAELLRYAGVRGEAEPEVAGLMESCIREASSIRSALFLYVPLRVQDGTVRLGSTGLSGGTIARTLAGAQEALVFAATLGFDMDRLIRRYQNARVSRAFMFQALGAERIESFLDGLDTGMLEGVDASLHIGKRCSPGYGDLPLEVQKPLLDFLEARKYLGLTLSPSLLISPSKTVTGFMALSPCRNGAAACADCSHPCAFRKTEVNA